MEQMNEESDEPPNKATLNIKRPLKHFECSDDSDEETNSPHNPAMDSTDAGSSSSSEESEDGRCSPMFSPALTANLTQCSKSLNLTLIGASTGYELPANYDPSGHCEELPQAGVAVSYVSPRLEARTCATGSGVFALSHIPKGTLLIVWTGRILTAEQTIPLMSTPDKHYILQIGDGFYQTPLQPHREPADWTNHSCSPNAGFGAQSPVCLSAMRDIEAGEEITFDYGMCETDERLWEPMECACGAEQCRKLITANDWKLHPQLWKRYEGFFSPHVQRKIDALKKQIQQMEKQERECPFNDIVDAHQIGWVDRVLWSLGLVRASAVKKACK